MYVLVACEESQEVCKAFRAKGHTAFSCDIQECSGGRPEWHIRENVTYLLNGNVDFITCDGASHYVNKWDMIIAFPPCTYLTTAATRAHSLGTYTEEQIRKRTYKRIEAMKFFLSFMEADCKKIAIENPRGVMGSCYRAADQIIQPYYFAESVNDEVNYQMKSTCLWLKGLPKLKTNDLPKPSPVRTYTTIHGKKKNVYFAENHAVINGRKNGRNDAEARSKTFPGVAKAMAEQWG